MGPTALLPLQRKACWGFFHPKNLTALARCEPANLGTKGQHATSRPPKPLGNDGCCDGVFIPSAWNYFEKLFHVPYLWNLFVGGLTAGLMFVCGIGHLEHAPPHDCLIQCFCFKWFLWWIFCHTICYLLETVTIRKVQQRIKIEVLVKLEKMSLTFTQCTVSFWTGANW
jgi:hypothetical protein